MRKSFVYVRRLSKLDRCEYTGCNKKAEYLIALIKKGEQVCLKRCKKHSHMIKHEYPRCVNCGCYLTY